MPQRLVGEPLRAGREVECFERHPAGVMAAAERVQHGLEIVVARPAVFAVQFVDVDVPDLVEVAVDQYGVRLGFVDRIVHVEHRPHRRTRDLAHDRRRLPRGVRITSACPAGSASTSTVTPRDRGVRRDRGQSVDEVAGRLLRGSRRRWWSAVWASRRPSPRPGRDRRRGPSDCGCVPSCGGAARHPGVVTCRPLGLTISQCRPTNCQSFGIA